MLGLKREDEKGDDQNARERKDKRQDQRKVSGSSAESFKGAIADAVSKATGLGDIAEAKVKHMWLSVQGGKVVEYMVELKFDSSSESEDEEDDD